MPPATATTKNGALSCPIRNDRTGRLDTATPRRGLRGSGADSRKKQTLLAFVVLTSGLKARRSRLQVQSGLTSCPLPDAVQQLDAGYLRQSGLMMSWRESGV